MNQNRLALAAGLLFGLLHVAGVAWADVVTLAPSKDNTLFESATGALSSGSGPGLFSGRTGQGLTSRAVLAFDVAGQVPPGSEIVSVTLSMHLVQTSSGPQLVGVHRLLADWGEGASVSGGGGGAPAEPGDATWIHTFFDGAFWASAGGDFAAAPSATAEIDQAGPYAWDTTTELVADVQGWLDDPSSDFGWIVVGNESTTQTAKRFGSRESPEPSLGPALTIEFTPPCLPDPAGQGYWHRQCLGVPENQGGASPGRRGRGRGPTAPTEPGFLEETLPCADDLLERLGLAPLSACRAMNPDPPSDPCERARRDLATLVLDVCSDRVQASCPLRGRGRRCGSATIGELLGVLAARIRIGDCRRASACASAPH